MLRSLPLFLVQIVLGQEVQLQKIADAYSSWATASPYSPKIPPKPQPVSPVRQYTHYVTVQAPPPVPKPIPQPLTLRQPQRISAQDPKPQPVPEPSRIHYSPIPRPVNPERPRYSRPPPPQQNFVSPSILSQQRPLSQISAQRLVRPQFHANPHYFYSSSSSLSKGTQYSPPLSLPNTLNNSYLLPQPQRSFPLLSTTARRTISEDMSEARELAAKKQRWGGQGPAFEFTCEFGFCGGGCCQPPSPPQPTQIHAAAMPGSLTHPLVLMLHPTPSHPQCSPACQPMCLPQCMARLQYMPLPMPEFFHQQPTCRSDCMPSCHVDCLIMPPMVIRCSGYPCVCNAGYRQCSPFTCCSSYTNMRAKFRSMVEDKSEESVEAKKKEKMRRMFTPVHIPYHGTPVMKIEGNATTTTTMEPETTTSSSTTSTTTARSTTTTTEEPTTTTTERPMTTIPTTTSTTTTTPLPVTPIYPDNVIPLVPVYELWRPKEKIEKAKEEEEIENFIRSNSFVEMLAELAQVKAKEDLDQTADNFIKYITENGK